MKAGTVTDADAAANDFDSVLRPGTFQLNAATPFDAVVVDGSCPSLVENPENEFVDDAVALVAFTPSMILEEKPLNAFTSLTVGRIQVALSLSAGPFTSE